jgi:hypothetical protein
LQLAHELVAPRRLEERVNGILLRLEKELDQAEEAIGEAQRLLEQHTRLGCFTLFAGC